MQKIDAHLRWNHTGIFLKQGQRYDVGVPPGQQWRDASFTCGPEGYTNLLVAPFTPFLRVRTANGRRARFFTLIGTIGESTKHAVIIGNGTYFTAGADGELVCFANDVAWAYFNNKGSIEIQVKPSIL
jgi:hypothetical protein